jgi:hypothetical protein
MRFWLISLCFLVTASVLSPPPLGHSQTEKGKAKKAAAPPAVKPQVDASKLFSFRGITVGMPLKEQFKDCKSQPAPGGCWKEGVKGEAFKQYQIEGLSKLDFASTEYVALLDDKVELILVEFNKEYAETKMMKLLKGQYGEPAAYKSEMLDAKPTDIPYEKFVATWNVKGCLLELSNVRESIVDSGRLLIRSEKYLKSEPQGGTRK